MFIVSCHKFPGKKIQLLLASEASVAFGCRPWRLEGRLVGDFRGVPRGRVGLLDLCG